MKNFIKNFSILALLLTSTFSTVAFSDEITTTPAATAAPNTFFTLTQYHYSFEGTKTANTSIYKFGKGFLDMTLLTGTYMASPDLMFLVFVPRYKNQITTVYEPKSASPTALTDVTQGLGDVRLMAQKMYYASANHLVFADLGFTAPTGGFAEKFSSTPSQSAAYNMQLGSGTYDIYIGGTYMNMWNGLNSKVRAEAAIRGGQNRDNWGLGDQYLLQASSLYSVASFFDTGFTAQIKNRGAVRGKNTKYELFNGYNNPGTGVSGDGHQYYHADQTNWDVNYVAQFKHQLGSYTLNAEIGIPLSQGMINKDDIDLETKYFVSGGITAAF